MFLLLSGYVSCHIHGLALFLYSKYYKMTLKKKPSIYILIILMCTCLNISAQTLKSYSGQYENVNPDKALDPGIASYTYKEGAGKRIYHGQFSYSDKDQTLKGNFVDDKQVGTWIYTVKTRFTAKNNYYSGKRVISVTYKNGIPDGPFSISLVDSKTGLTKAYIRGEFVNGRLAGDLKADLNTGLFDGHRFDSSFDLPYINLMSGAFDDSGKPANIWKVYSPTCEIIERYDPTGGVKVSTTNPSTGETIDDERPAYMPNIILEAANYALRSTRMRSSEIIQLSPFDLPRPDDAASKQKEEEVNRRLRKIFGSKSSE